MNLYEILGVPETATSDEIKQKYKSLAKKMHPDKLTNPSEDSISKFQELTNAYNILSDTDKRQQYDMEQNGGPEISFNDFFRSFHMTFSNQRSDCVNIDLELTLKEMYTGCEKTVKFNRKILCKTCKGVGGKNKKTCLRCRGQGRIASFFVNGLCHDCDGCGYKVNEICIDCSGRRYNIEMVEKNIKLKHGISEKNTFILKEWGDETINGKEDVRLVINQYPSKTFKRVGDNIGIELNISFFESFTKNEFQFKHINDELISFKTDEVIDPTKTYRKKGFGFNNSDLLITFKIKYPKKSDLKLNKFCIQ